MPLYTNGTLIPENVANALIVNGVNITQVIANGVAVWTQNLFNGVWSGSSYTSPGQTWGIDVSGTAYRIIGYNFSNYSNYFYGNWLYTNSSGMGSGDSTISAAGYTSILRTTTTTLWHQKNNTGAGGTVLFNTATKSFSSESVALISGYRHGFVTGGGLLRYEINGTYSPYISLT